MRTATDESSNKASVNNTHTHTHTHTRLTALCPRLPRWAGTRKVKPILILLKQETMSGSGISWAICKSGPHSRQTTTPAAHHSVFLQARCPSYLPAAQPTASKHWRQQVLIMTLLKSQIPGRLNTHSHLNHQTTQQLSGDIVVSPTKTLGQQSLLSTNQSYTRRMVTKPFSLRTDILLLQSLSMWSGMLTMVFSNKNTWMSNFQTNWISIWQQILSSAD